MMGRILFVVCAALTLVLLWVAVPAATAQSGEPWGFYLAQSLGTTLGMDVALGDLDGDGDLDVYVANGDGQQQPDRVWINQGGSGPLLVAGATVGESDSRAVALGDVDRDGDLDAVVVYQDESNRVWLNDGHAQFTDSGQNLGSGAGRDVALADLDGDHDLDAFIVYDDGQPDKIWRNNGSGGFTDSGQALGTTSSRAVALGDIDGDGSPDAFVAVYGEGHRVWLNEGDGNFTATAQSLGSASYQTYDVALGYLNDDGFLDAVVAMDMANEVYFGAGSGQFAAAPMFVGENESNGVALGDIDRDGWLDIVFANYANQPNEIWLNGGGTFSFSGRTLGSSWSRAVALGDLNGDGGLDAVVANSYDQADEVYLMVNVPTSVGLSKMTVSAGTNWTIPAVALLGMATLLLAWRRRPRRG